MSDIRSISYEDAQLVTPSDTVNVPGGQAAGFCAGSAGGTVTVTTLGNTKIQITAVVGIIYPITISRIWATGTAASGLFAVYAVPYQAKVG